MITRTKQIPAFSSGVAALSPLHIGQSVLACMVWYGMARTSPSFTLFVMAVLDANPMLSDQDTLYTVYVRYEKALEALRYP